VKIAKNSQKFKNYEKISQIARKTAGLCQK